MIVDTRESRAWSDGRRETIERMTVDECLDIIRKRFEREQDCSVRYIVLAKGFRKKLNSLGVNTEALEQELLKDIR